MRTHSEDCEVVRSNVSRETFAKLELFEKTLNAWNPRVNLVATSTIAQFWSRHVSDSLQLMDVATTRGLWLDMGSGGGFPCLVVAAASGPEAQFVLVESDSRKAEFIRTVARQMGLKVTVLNDRVENAAPQNADVVSARALAPLQELLGYAARHLAPEGTCVFLKGARALDEVAAARKAWNFDLQIVQSITDPSGSVLKITKLSHV